MVYQQRTQKKTLWVETTASLMENTHKMTYTTKKKKRMYLTFFLSKSQKYFCASHQIPQINPFPLLLNVNSTNSRYFITSMQIITQNALEKT